MLQRLSDVPGSVNLKKDYLSFNALAIYMRSWGGQNARNKKETQTFQKDWKVTTNFKMGRRKRK